MVMLRNKPNSLVTYSNSVNFLFTCLQVDSIGSVSGCRLGSGQLHVCLILGPRLKGFTRGNSSPGKWQEHKRQANHARVLKALLISRPLAFHWLKQAKAKGSQWGVDSLSGKPQQGQKRKEEFCTDNATCHPQVAQEVPLCHENIPALGTRPGCHRISRQCRDGLGSGSSPVTFLLLNTIFLYRS